MNYTIEQLKKRAIEAEKAAVEYERMGGHWYEAILCRRISLVYSLLVVRKEQAEG